MVFTSPIKYITIFMYFDNSSAVLLCDSCLATVTVLMTQPIVFCIFKRCFMDPHKLLTNTENLPCDNC